jgi:hypothetical protein
VRGRQCFNIPVSCRFPSGRVACTHVVVLIAPRCLIECCERRLGVLVEVNCETDFVGRGDQFKELVSNIAMQVRSYGC